MKQYTQSELQKMYMEPSEELKDRIHQEISSLPIKAQKEEIVKKKLSFSFVIVIAILLVLVAVAYAATEVFHGSWMNWEGNTVTVQEEESTQSTDETSFENATDDAAFDNRFDYFLNRTGTKDEYVTVEAFGTFGSRKMTRTVDSWESFQHKMKSAGYLIYPSQIPDGYQFAEATFFLTCRDGEDYHLVEELVEDGITVRRYTLDDAQALITGYSVTFLDENDSEAFLEVFSTLEREHNIADYYINLGADQTPSVLEIPGIDQAIVVFSEDKKTSSLLMRKVLDTPVIGKQRASHDREESIVYSEQHLSIQSSTLSEESYVRMFVPAT